MQIFLQDVRYAARMLMKKPGFTLLAMITLGLGIGANTAIFSVVSAVLLKPLPYKDPQQLVWVWEVQAGRDQTQFSPAEFLDYQAQNQVFTGMAAYRPMAFTLTGEGEPEHLNGLIVTDNFFSLLGVAAERGRSFQPEDGQSGAPRVAVVSHDFWQTRFGSDPNLVGKTLILSGESVTVVGVMPPGFQDNSHQIWLNPRQVVPDWGLNSRVDLLTLRHTSYLRVLARLKPGVTLGQAQVDLNTIAERLQQAYPRPTGHGAGLMFLHDQVVGNVRSALLILLGAVGLVLLIACANLTSLTLARATARYKEIAVRAALGASRWQIVRGLLLESILLALAGGLGGWLLAVWGIDLLVAISPQDIPRLLEVKPDYQVFLFTLGVSLLTGLIFGLVPSLLASNANLNTALKEGTRSATSGTTGNLLRQSFVVAEVALALVIMIGAGLLVRSFTRLLAVNPGFEPQHLLTMGIGLTDERYSRGSAKARLVRELNGRLEAVPGVQGVGFCDDLPITGTDSTTRINVEGRPSTSSEDLLSVGLHVINPGYFDAMGVQLIKGRTFTEHDDANAPSVFIINETMAHRLWQDEEPLGKRIRYNNNDPWGEVVGVVADIKHDGIHLPSGPHLYEPYQQNAWPFLAITLRSPTDRSALLNIVRQEVQALDPQLPVFNVRMMDEVMAQSLATRRLVLTLFALFAAVALVLAGVGIYGVLAYAVSQRMRELGIRMAFGATARDVLQLIVKQGMMLVLLGIAIGLSLAIAFNRLLTDLVFGVSTSSPLTFLSISLILAGVALVACLVPARRATKVDPMVVLRYE